MIFCVEEDHEHEGDEPDSGDAFDRRRSDLLDAEADLLREHAERLIAHGSISVERPTGMVTARFRGPLWRYHGGGPGIGGLGWISKRYRRTIPAGVHGGGL
jgi:hypothetical protein